MSTNLNDFGSVLVSGLNKAAQSEIFHHGNGWDASNSVVVAGNVYITSAVMGDGLVRRSNGVHTLYVSTTKFTGNVQILATLGKDPINSYYLPANVVSTIDGTTHDHLSFNQSNVSSFYTITGQYSWLKANISDVHYGGTLNLLKIAF